MTILVIICTKSWHKVIKNGNSRCYQEYRSLKSRCRNTNTVIRTHADTMAFLVFVKIFWHPFIIPPTKTHKSRGISLTFDPIWGRIYEQTLFLCPLLIFSNRTIYRVLLPKVSLFFTRHNGKNPQWNIRSPYIESRGDVHMNDFRPSGRASHM